MKSFTMAALLAALAFPAADRVDHARPVATGASAAAPSIGWLALDQAVDDRADTLWRDARTALNRGDYDRAAQLFREIRVSHAASRHAADAPYWEAFAIYRTGDERRFRTALEVLSVQRDRWPEASTRGDARTLEIRIKGRLAQSGDADAAGDVAERARSLADTDEELREAQREAREREGEMREREREGARESREAARETAAADRARGARSSGGSCGGGEEDDRVAALNALLQMSPDRAVPILRRVLARRDQCSEVLRRKAVFLVAQKVTPETENILLDAMRNDPDAEVREQAVFWLSQVPTERAVDALEQILFTSRDSNIREKALFALSQHRSPRGGAILRDVARSDSMPNDVRDKAIFWIGQRRSAENAAFLRDLYTRLRNEELKDKVIFSVSQMRGEGSQKWLLDIAADSRESIEMRKKALFWAGQSGLAASDLATMYDRLTDAEMKDQAIFVLSQKRDREAVDKLMAIAKTDKDRELRKKAVFWLSQSRDPRVAEFLESLISQ